MRTVLIASRYDPTEEDIPRIEEHVSNLLQAPTQNDQEVKDGKLRIRLSTSPSRELSPKRYALTVPAGYDFAIAEGRTASPGEPHADAMAVAWKTLQKWRWVRGPLGELKKAAAKFSAQNAPGVAYLNVPNDELPTVWLRMQILATEVRAQLRHAHRSVSAVVLTGEGEWKAENKDRTKTAVVTAMYEPILNENARFALPPSFLLLGRDFRALSTTPEG